MRLVRSVVASGKEWRTNGHTCHLGHYQTELHGGDCVGGLPEMMKLRLLSTAGPPPRAKAGFVRAFRIHRQFKARCHCQASAQKDKREGTGKDRSGTEGEMGG